MAELQHITFRPSTEERCILIVEDETVNLRLLTRYLEGSYSLITARTGAQALEIIYEHHETISLIMLDLNLPDLQGVDMLRMLKDNPQYAHLPIIIMTADSKAEVESLTLGAIDFIPKPYPQREVVLARIRRVVELSEDRDTLRWTERDHLTHLYNKDFFYHYAVLLDEHHKDVQTDAMVIDINHFHTINERFGRNFGDRVLCRIADRAMELVKDSGGIVCRSGADTFFIYCPHLDDYSDFPEKLEVCIEDEESGEHRIHVRVGVYSCVDKSLDIERRFDRAKIAADTVRGSITNAICFYDHDMYEKELLAEQLIEAFPTALKEKQFYVYYQPKFNVSTDIPVLCSAEALVRWNHPSMGMVSPGVFIPLFENNGMIEALDYYVWKEAAKEIRRLKDTLGIKLPISVNVSRVDMLDPSLIGKLLGIVRENGLECSDLILEITESAYTEDSGAIIETAKKLHDYGFVIEMDDFGTGYSSLNMLASLPIDVLKLDMLFIRSAFLEQRSKRLLEAIISLVKVVEVPCVAEGVETAEQFETIKKMGCDIIQGYYFSRPLPAPDFEQFVREHNPSSEAMKS